MYIPGVQGYTDSLGTTNMKILTHPKALNSLKSKMMLKLLTFQPENSIPFLQILKEEFILVAGMCMANQAQEILKTIQE